MSHRVSAEPDIARSHTHAITFALVCPLLAAHLAHASGPVEGVFEVLGAAVATLVGIIMGVVVLWFARLNGITLTFSAIAVTLSPLPVLFAIGRYSRSFGPVLLVPLTPVGVALAIRYVLPALVSAASNRKRA